MASTRTLAYAGKEVEPDVRMLSDLKGVLYDKGAVIGIGDAPAYYMYRDLALSKKDKDTLLENDLRYDITVIPPRMLGIEYVKTLGHYHPLIPKTKTSYPEVYEVLSGEAHYLLQKEEKGRITDVVLVKAEKNDKVVIPPNYGHVTINPSNKELKMANLVSRAFESDYKPYLERRGGAYYELSSGFVANKNYGKLPDLRELDAKRIPELGLGKRDEIYALIKKDIEALSFLNKPQDFGWLSSLYHA